MTQLATLPLVYLGAAIAEIAGSFAVWAWLRNGQSVLWLIPGGVMLFAFAYLLTLIPAGYAGRAYASYGGVYIAASLGWLWLVESRVPDRWDLIGAALALAGAAVIVLAPRGG